MKCSERARALLLAAVATVTVGCGGSIFVKAPPGGRHGYRIKLVISIADGRDPLQAATVGALESQAAHFPLRILRVFDARGVAVRQAAQIRALIHHPPNGLLVLVEDPQTVGPAVAEASRSGIKVVSLTSPAPARVLIDVGSNDIQIGAAACHFVVSRISGRGEVLDIESASFASATVHRALTACIATSSSLQVVALAAPDSAGAAAAATRAALRSIYDLRAIVMESDAREGPAVLPALATVKPHILTVTIDGSRAALAALRRSVVDLVIARQLSRIARIGVARAFLAIRGRAPKIRAPRDDSLGNPEILFPGLRIGRTNLASAGSAE